MDTTETGSATTDTAATNAANTIPACLSDAYINEALLHILGLGQRKVDYHIAVGLLATAGDHPIAHFLRLWLYETGTPKYTQISPTAKGWFNRLCMLVDSPLAQVCIAYCYYYGYDDAECNYELTVAYATKAANDGPGGLDTGASSLAYYLLGMCHEKGRGVPKDTTLAAYWYNKAAEQQNVLGCVNLGYCYDRGIGVLVDSVKAMTLYTNAAEQGDGVGRYNLAYCYNHGRGVAKDLTRAVSLYTPLAEQSDSDSQCRLGLIYNDVKDRDTALKWFSLAAAQKHQQATIEMRLILASVRTKDVPSLALEEKPDTKCPDMACCICALNVRTVVFLPCKHMPMCFNCTAGYLNDKSTCPVCRGDITEIMKIYI